MNISTALDWTRQNKEIQDAIKKSIKEEFPIESGKKVLTFENITMVDNQPENDYPAIKELKLARKSYQIPIYGTAVLTDKVTGEVVDRIEKFKIANVPKMTRWYSMIIDGNEYQTVNQLRLKSGIYTRIKDNGDLESRFNLKKGFNFTMILPPERGIFFLVTKNAKYRVYNILQSLGMGDEEILKTWGRVIYDKNRKGSATSQQADIIQLYKELTRTEEDFPTASAGLKKYFEGTSVDPTTTKITLGTSYDKVSQESLLATSKKLLEVMQGKQKPDERESLIFKDLFGVEDLVTQYFDKNKDNLIGKIRFRMDKKEKIREILSSTTYSKPIKSFFTTSDLASTSEQTNPAQIIANAQKVTFMGTGGIGSRHAITTDVRDLHPTHLSFIDPLATPESSKSGVSLGLARDIVKDGGDMKTALRMPDGKREYKTVQEFYDLKIGFGDQYAVVNKIPIARSRKVKGIYKGETGVFLAKDIDAWIFSPSNMFSYTTNLVPYMANDSGNRVAMATRMLGQSIPILGREAPLVQTRWKGNESFQKVVGNFMNPAPGPGWNGTVTKVTDDYVSLKLDKPDADGKTNVKVGMFNNYPLNQESFINNTATVGVGDKVTPNKSLAESNFTKDGVLAMGANVNVAYMPWKGLTFEDSAVVSESFATQFTSEKIVKKNIYVNNKTDKFDFKVFKGIFPEAVSPENEKKLDDLGLVKVGSKIDTGEVIAAYLSELDFSDEERILKQMNRAISEPYKKRIVEWTEGNPGVVLYVKRVGKNIDIHIKVQAPMIVGDKLAGLHGNKAIISRIVPDDEMPHTKKDGERIDMIFSPVTVPGRMNIGQIAEAAAGKLIAKTDGKPRILDNFVDRDQIPKIYKEMKEKNVSIEDTMTDGIGGKDFGTKIFWGKPYIMKLRHTVDHKIKSRNIGSYDINDQPSRGKDSGQTMGNMEVMAMLSHGAKANLYEATSLKGQENDEYWRALQLGLPTPVPKANFAFEKMLSYLKQSGVNVEKKGDILTLMPMTDKEVDKISSGIVKSGGEMLIAKNLKTIKGGLFDPEIFGGSSGKKWGHFNLNTKIPNPIMEDAITKLLNLTGPRFESILSGKETLYGKTGPEAIEGALKLINVDKEIISLTVELGKAPDQKVNVINKKIRYLRALKKFDMKPTDYMIKKIPILPPLYRPIYPLPSGDLMISPINRHYRDVWLLDKAVGDVKKGGINVEEFNKTNKVDLYRAVKSLQGLVEPLTYSKEKYEGGIKTLAGPSPKHGFIHDKLFSKKQDLSARSTVGLDPSLGIDEVGLPEDMTKKLFKPFVIRELVMTGMKAVEAAKAVRDWTPMADVALDAVIKNRPVLMNRAPSLHKHSIQAFKVKRAPGKTITTNPLINSGFNLDYDGDDQINNVCMWLSHSDLQHYSESSKIKLDYDLLKYYIISTSQIGEIMSRYNVKTQIKENGEYFLINLEDFPYNKEDLLGSKDDTDFYSVPDGIEVFAYDESKQKVELKKVSGWSVHRDKEVYTINLQNKLQIISDDDPRAVYGIKPTTLEFTRCRPKDSIGMLVPVVRGFDESMNLKNTKNTIHRGDSELTTKSKIELNKRTGYVFGSLVGDGWATDAQTVLSGIEPNIKKQYSEFVQDFFKKDVHIGNISMKNSYGRSEKLVISNKDFSGFIKPMIGSGAKNKHLPPMWFSGNRSFKLGLISGLMDTDGSIAISNAKKKPQIHINYSSISIRLIQELQQLLRGLGVYSKIGFSRVTDAGNDAWMLSISAHDFKKIKDDLNNVHELNLKALNREDAYPVENTPEFGRNDLVPIDLKTADSFISQIGAKRDSPKNLKSLYQILYKAKKTGYIRRQTAENLMKLYGKVKTNKVWMKLVNDKSVSWQPVVSYENTGKVETGYDLTVPGHETFMSIDGIILSNTMSVHVPVGLEAVDEAWGMLPSKNIFKHGDNSVVPELAQEYQYGIYFLTKAGKDTNKSFSSLTGAKAAGLTKTDMFMLNGKKTSIGKEIVNSTIPIKYRNYKDSFSKKVVSGILERIAKESPNDFPGVINSLKDLGHKYAHAESSTVSISDFAESRKFRDDILKKYTPLVEKAPTKEKKIKLWLKATDEVRLAQDKQSKDTNNIYKWIESGGLSGSKAPNVLQILSMPGVVTDVRGRPIEEPILKSFGEGLDMAGYWNTMYGVRRGIVDTAVSTSAPGALTKSLIGNVWSTIISEEDCGTSKSLSFNVETDGKDIIDRCLAENIMGVGKKDDIIDPGVYNKLKNKKITMVKVRSPLTCETVNGLCKLCYGILPTGEFPEKGYNVGISDAHAVAERSTQLVLRTKHTGAAFSGAAEEASSGGFDRLTQLLKTPVVVPNKATLAPVSGRITALKPDALGGWNVMIGTKAVNVPSGKTLLVSVGSTVNKGDKLSAGSIKPQEYADLKSHKEAQLGIINELDGIYKKDFHKKTFETVIRAISNNARITETPKSSTYLRGDVTSIQNIDSLNKERKTDGLPDIQFKPFFKSIDVLPQDQESWLDRVGTNRIVEAIRESAATGAASNIHGTSPIPGYFYGAEFGKKPGSNY